MKKKWVKIRLETKAREFYSKTLLMYNLLDKGYGIILSENIEFYPRGISFLNSIYFDLNKKLKKLKKHRDKIVVLHEEGLVVKEEEYIKANPKKNLQIIDKFFCYGKYQYGITNKYFPNSNKTVITGNPRNNILTSMFELIEKEKVDKIKKKYGNFILYVSTARNTINGCDDFSPAARYKYKLEMFKKMGLVLNTTSEESLFKEKFFFDEKILEKTLELFREIEEKYPQIKIIIRPHPSENRKFWEEKFIDSKNIKVIYEGTLTEWIKASSLVIQNGCTSSIESLLIGKKCISYKPISDKRFDIELVDNTSLNIVSKEKLMSLIVSGYNENFKNLIVDSEEYKKYLEKYISYSKKDESILKIIEELEKLEIPKIKFAKYKYKIIGGVINYEYLIKKYVGLLIYKILEKIKITKFKWMKTINKKVQSYYEDILCSKEKFEDISINEINNLFSKYNKIYNKKLKVKMLKMNEKVFVLEKEE